MADRVGQQVGNYRLMRLLGQGGSAEVYLGEHIHLETEAAIKLLHTYLVGKDKEAFRKEARTIARLVHPNIVRVFDFGIENDAPFLVMDYAPNGTLRSRHPKGVELPLPTIIDYVRQIANALQYAHDERFVHCDIKPENLLVGRRQEILLTDFGIARIAQTSRSQSMQNVAGTANYIAPEQLQGKPRAASDQYTLAIMVYEWLTGTCPFQGNFVALAAQHLLTPPPPLQRQTSTISPEVEQVVMTALAKDPKQRFGSVTAFATALQQAIDSTSPQEQFSTHQSTNAADESPATNQITESLIPTEQSRPPHSSPPSAEQQIPLPRPSSIRIDTGATAPRQLGLRQPIEQQLTQQLQPNGAYQPSVLLSPPPAKDLPKQALYPTKQSPHKQPTQQAVHSQSPHPVRKYPYINRIAGVFLLIIALVGGSFFLINGGILSRNSTTPTPNTAVSFTPTPTPPVIVLGFPYFTVSNLTSNPDGTQAYSANIQAKDKTNPAKSITADGITCRLWLVPQGGGNRENDPGTHFLTTATDQLQHPDNPNQRFPQEIQNALNFTPPTQGEVQACVQGSATWKFTISPSVVHPGNYYLVGLTDWQGKSYSWVWKSITIG